MRVNKTAKTQKPRKCNNIETIGEKNRLPFSPSSFIISIITTVCILQRHQQQQQKLELSQQKLQHHQNAIAAVWPRAVNIRSLDDKASAPLLLLALVRKLILLLNM